MHAPRIIATTGLVNPFQPAQNASSTSSYAARDAAVARDASYSTMSAPDAKARSPRPDTTTTLHLGIVGERGERARRGALHREGERVPMPGIVEDDPADAGVHLGDDLRAAGLDVARHAPAGVSW